MTLEPSLEQINAWVATAMAPISEHLRTLAVQPPMNPLLASQLAREIQSRRSPDGSLFPSAGVALDEILKPFFEEWVPQTVNTAGPGYLAYIPGGGLFASALADLISNSVNRYVGVGSLSPPLVALEFNVLRFFCDLAGYPPEAGGYLTAGGSAANLGAILAARSALLSDDNGGFGDLRRGVIYVSEHAHHSLQKSANIAGFATHQIRSIRCGADYRILIPELSAAIECDAAAGLVPFFVAGSAGTTNTGAVDDLLALSKLCKARKIWFHVDGAYGGFFLMTERGRKRFAGIEAADSLTLDPHKGLFLPYGTGCLLVRDQETLRSAHQMRADYLPQKGESEAVVNFSEISPELSRDFRGLRVWLPLMLHGVKAFESALDEKLDLAQEAHAAILKLPGFKIMAPPELSLLAFRFEQPGRSGPELDQLNEKILGRVNSYGRVYLTSTRLSGQVAIRICVLSFRTHALQIDQAIEDLRRASADLT